MWERRSLTRAPWTTAYGEIAAPFPSRGSPFAHRVQSRFKRALPTAAGGEA